MALQNIYIFGWPSFVGGADTKLAHLLKLLNQDFNITVVPNRPKFLGEHDWIGFIHRHGIQICLLDDLPNRVTGYALALSNKRFFTEGIAKVAKDKGLKVVWSSEMMWHHPGELDAIQAGLIDKALFVSDIQRNVLSKAYGFLPTHVVGNYIDPAAFPFQEENQDQFTIGRLSRADPEKYPEDFPVFYERLQLPNVRFRVMAWSSELREKYRWHQFDDCWDLLTALQESQSQFLRSLDLFVYPLGHKFVESWGRSTVEAMLSGAIPLVPSGHNFENLMIHGTSGFICSDFYEFRSHSQELFHNRSLRLSMRRAAREHAEHNLCNRAKHLAIWKEVFE